MNIDYTRLHSEESEQSVLGALLHDPESSDRLGALKPEHFFTEANRTVFTQILTMIGAGRPVDIITVAEEIESKGFSEQTGGLAYLGNLVANTPGAANIGRYAQIVVGKALERQLIGAAQTITETVSGSGTTTEKLTVAQSAVMSITEAVASKEPRLMREVLLSAAETLEQRGSGQVSAMPTGFVDLDRTLAGGLRPGNVIVVAGRPAMGKTALAVNIAYQVARAGNTALVLSMEMQEQELADRLIAQAGSVYLSDVLAGNMEGDSGDRIMAAVGALHDLKIVIDDQGGLTLFDVAQKARTTKRKHGLHVLVVDYIQLMSGDGDGRVNEIATISRGIKALAKELEIPIVLLSQLSRNCESRPNRRPMMSDLRDSGSIEQDADVILGVYRDEVYNEQSPDRGTAEIIVLKNRQGQTGLVRMSYQGCYTRFNDLEHGWSPAPTQAAAPKRRRGMCDD